MRGMRIDPMILGREKHDRHCPLVPSCLRLGSDWYYRATEDLLRPSLKHL